VNWRGAMGVRDVMAHGYFQVNAYELFGICRDDVPRTIEALRKIIRDLQHGAG
jgi:uncharacterized protein with HEPN domain